MKNFVFFVGVFALLFGCKKVKELLDISFSFTTKNDFTLPKAADQVVSVPDSLVTISTPEIINTIPDEFKKNKADINKVKSVVIESLNLNIKSPQGQTFGFLKSVSIYLGAPGKKDTLIASKSGINLINPEPISLNLDVNSVNLVDYIKGPTYHLRVDTRIVKTYTSDIIIGSEIKFKAVANPLN